MKKESIEVTWICVLNAVSYFVENNISIHQCVMQSAKSFYMGLIANESNFKTRMNSTRDMEGRGTLVSSIVAKNYVEGAQEIDTQIRNSQRKPLPNLKITQTQQL